VVEGDIYHRSLAIEENAQFEGMSRRQENVIDTPSLVPSKRIQAQPISIDVNGQNGGAPEGLNSPQAAPIDRNRRGKTTSDVPNP
jgi:cytoskeletal protein CcmA (bactofilin family)